MLIDATYFIQLTCVAIALTIIVRGVHSKMMLHAAPGLCIFGVIALYFNGIAATIVQELMHAESPGALVQAASVLVRVVFPVTAFLALATGIGAYNSLSMRAQRNRRSARALAETMEKLGESERLIDGIMRSTLGGAFVLRAITNKYGNVDDFKFEICNGALEHLLCAHRSHIVGSSPARINRHDVGMWILEQSRAAVETGLPIHTERSFDGGYRTQWFELALASAGQYVTGMIVDTTTRKSLEMEHWKDAHTDPLTGLANRKLLVERLESEVVRTRTAGGTRGFAIMFFDFDGFKNVNDTLGHDAGDQLLRNIADRLRNVVSALSSNDTGAAAHLISRLGGDEFVVLLAEYSEREDVAKLAARFIDVMAEPHDLSGHEAVSTASIGVTVCYGEHATAEHVLGEADQAMYVAKRSGKGRFVFFDEIATVEQSKQHSGECGDVDPGGRKAA